MARPIARPHSLYSVAYLLQAREKAVALKGEGPAIVYGHLAEFGSGFPDPNLLHDVHNQLALAARLDDLCEVVSAEAQVVRQEQIDDFGKRLRGEVGLRRQ